MFVCENNSNCCNYKFCNSYNDLDEEGKNCSHLIEVEPVRYGHWEQIINPYGELEGWICECGREVKSQSNYCPNCGAKMIINNRYKTED